jgi:hypothetical protein
MITAQYPKIDWLLPMLILLSITACTKNDVLEVVPDNIPPTVNNIPAIRIENYVNRVFIDLIGREPLDSEMETEVQLLRDAQLDVAARKALIEKLQTNTDFIEGDSSYTQAYHQHFYNLAKVRCLEGASDNKIEGKISEANDSSDIIRLKNVIRARKDLQNGLITIDEFFGRMVHNLVYDQINMNTFNFINATFDNLLWRYPTDAEFTAGFNMVEFNEPHTLMGQTGASKTEYVDILTHSGEMYEGLIIWAYQLLLSRTPTTEETFALLPDFYQTKDLKKVQQSIMVTDEYAGF